LFTQGEDELPNKGGRSKLWEASTSKKGASFKKKTGEVEGPISDKGANGHDQVTKSSEEREEREGGGTQKDKKKIYLPSKTRRNKGGR